MTQYDPDTDGYAAQSGFENGDILRGIEVCSLQQDNSENTTTTTTTIQRRLIKVDNFSDKEWKEMASSCEFLDPKKPSVFIIER